MRICFKNFAVRSLTYRSYGQYIIKDRALPRYGFILRSHLSYDYNPGIIALMTDEEHQEALFFLGPWVCARSQLRIFGSCSDRPPAHSVARGSLSRFIPSGNFVISGEPRVRTSPRYGQRRLYSSPTIIHGTGRRIASGLNLPLECWPSSRLSNLSRSVMHDSYHHSSTNFMNIVLVRQRLHLK